jgi:hypothetical protein
MIVDLMITYWMFTAVAGLIVVAFIINLFDKHVNVDFTFTYKEMPTMRPLTIPTKGKGFWGAIWMWIMTSRQWEITKDWRYEINDQKFVIPKGFVFDGASIPKFFRAWLSPVGVLMMGGLVHDYAYKYETLLLGNKKTTIGVINQKLADRYFKDINISVNGFRVLNYIGYYALRLGGYFAWKGHRNRKCDWKDSVGR